LRPECDYKFDDYIGQSHLVGPGKLLKEGWWRQALPFLLSLGETRCPGHTFGNFVHALDAQFIEMCVMVGVKEIRARLIRSLTIAIMSGAHTVLFVDEVQ